MISNRIQTDSVSLVTHDDHNGNVWVDNIRNDYTGNQGIEKFEYRFINDGGGGGGGGGGSVTPPTTINKPIETLPVTVIDFIKDDCPPIDEDTPIDNSEEENNEWDFRNSYILDDRIIDFDRDNNRFVESDAIIEEDNNENIVEPDPVFFTQIPVEDINVIKQKDSIRKWNFYTYNIDNSYISKLYDSLYSDYATVRLYDNESRNLIKSFNKYIINNTSIVIEFVGLSEYEINEIQIQGEQQPKLDIRVTSIQLTNLDYYITTTNGCHVDYDGTIYFVNDKVCEVTVTLSAYPSIKKTVKVKPRNISKVLDALELNKTSTNIISLQRYSDAKEVADTYERTLTLKLDSQIQEELKTNKVFGQLRYNGNLCYLKNNKSDMLALECKSAKIINNEYVEVKLVGKSSALNFITLNNEYQLSLVSNKTLENFKPKSDKVTEEDKYNKEKEIYERLEKLSVDENNRLVINSYKTKLSKEDLSIKDLYTLKKKLKTDPVLLIKQEYGSSFIDDKELDPNTLYRLSCETHELVSINVVPANGLSCELCPKVKFYKDANNYQLYTLGKGAYNIIYTVYDESTLSFKTYERNIQLNYFNDDIYDIHFSKFNIINNEEYSISINISNKIISPSTVILKYDKFNYKNDSIKDSEVKINNNPEIEFGHNPQGMLINIQYLFNVKYDNNKELPLRYYIILGNGKIISEEVIVKGNTVIKQTNDPNNNPNAGIMLLDVIGDGVGNEYASGLKQKIFNVDVTRHIAGNFKIGFALSDNIWLGDSLAVVGTIRDSKPVVNNGPLKFYPPRLRTLQKEWGVELSSKQLTYLSYISKKYPSDLDFSTYAKEYLTAQKFEKVNTAKSISPIDSTKLLTLSDVNKEISASFKTTNINVPSIAVKQSSLDVDKLLLWNVSPILSNNNPSIITNLSEYFGRTTNAFIFSNKEKNYNITISKNEFFDSEFQNVKLNLTITDNDRLDIEFDYKIINVVNDNGVVETQYFINDDSLIVNGVLDGKEIKLKYNSNCLYNNLTGKITILENKDQAGYNLVFGADNSKKRISFSFTSILVNEVNDDLVVEGKYNDKSIKIPDKLNILTEDYKKSSVINKLIPYDTTDDINIYYNNGNLVSNRTSFLFINRERESGFTYNGTKSCVRNIEYTINDINHPLDNNFYIYLDKGAIKSIYENSAQLNLITDTEYTIQYYCENEYSVRIIVKDKFIKIVDKLTKSDSFKFNYTDLRNRYGYILALVFVDKDENVIDSYKLNAAFEPYTKSKILLERVRQTPLFFFNDALSAYSEDESYDDLLPSKTFYEKTFITTTADKKEIRTTYSALSYTDELFAGVSALEKYEDFGQLSVIDNKFPAFKVKSLPKTIETYTGVLSFGNTYFKNTLSVQCKSKEINGINILPSKYEILSEDIRPTKTLNLEETFTRSNLSSISNLKILSDNRIICKYKGETVELKVTKSEIKEKFIQHPSSLKYLGYMIYYYNMNYLKKYGWNKLTEDSDDTIYYLILLDKLGNNKNFTEFFNYFKNSNFKEIEDILAADTNTLVEIDKNIYVPQEVSLNYIDYVNSKWYLIVNYWEKRIRAYQLLEDVLNEYDENLTISEQITKYAQVVNNSVDKLKRLYYILTTETNKNSWVVSNIVNRLYDQPSIYYLWSSVYNILFEDEIENGLINETILDDIYNYGLYPEIDVPEKDKDGMFVPYKIDEHGKIVKSENGWCGDDKPLYEYKLNSNGQIESITYTYNSDDDEDNTWDLTTFKTTKLDEKTTEKWVIKTTKNEEEVSESFKETNWGSLIKLTEVVDGEKTIQYESEYYLNNKDNLILLTFEKKNRLIKSKKYPLEHKIKFIKEDQKSGTKIQIFRKIGEISKKRTVNTHEDISNYWLDLDRINIIKTNKKNLLFGIVLQRFLCQLFLSELRKSLSMISVLHKFNDIHNRVDNAITSWNNIKGEDSLKTLTDFNVESFTFERNALYIDDKIINGYICYAYSYYDFDNHKISKYNDTYLINVDVNSLYQNRLNTLTYYLNDDEVKINLFVNNKVALDSKYFYTYTYTETVSEGTTNNSTGSWGASFATPGTPTRPIGGTSLGNRVIGTTLPVINYAIPSLSTASKIMQEEKLKIYKGTTTKSNYAYVAIIPPQSSGIKPFGIWPKNIKNPTCWSTFNTDLVSLPNFTNYDNIKNYSDVDVDGFSNCEVVMNMIKSGKMVDAPAIEAAYNYIPESYTVVQNNQYVAYTYSYALKRQCIQNTMLSNFEDKLSAENISTYMSISSSRITNGQIGSINIGTYTTYVSASDLSYYNFVYTTNLSDYYIYVYSYTFESKIIKFNIKYNCSTYWRTTSRMYKNEVLSSFDTLTNGSTNTSNFTNNANALIQDADNVKHPEIIKNKENEKNSYEFIINNYNELNIFDNKYLINDNTYEMWVISDKSIENDKNIIKNIINTNNIDNNDIKVITTNVFAGNDISNNKNKAMGYPYYLYTDRKLKGSYKMYQIQVDRSSIEEKTIMSDNKNGLIEAGLNFFLGSVSQWQLVQDNVKEINKALLKCDEEHPDNIDLFYEGRWDDNREDNRLFWTSSEIDQNRAWMMFFNSSTNTLMGKTLSAYVRPFLNITYNYNTNITWNYKTTPVISQPDNIPTEFPGNNSEADKITP